MTLRPTRLLQWGRLAGLLLATALRAQTLALTLDDAPGMGPTPKLGPQARSEALLKVLGAHGVQVAIFVNGIDGGDTPEGRQILARWGQEGHLVGNHTYAHLNLQKVSLAEFTKDFLRCDALLKGIPNYARLLRFPYLKEGDTLEKRDGMRRILQENGYRNAAVTIATFDWLIDEHLRSALKRDPLTPLEPYRAYYLQHLATIIRHYQALGRAVAGREVQHVVLLHLNLLNALFLEDVLGMLAKNGWKLVSPATAYQDPIYAEDPRTLTAGESLLWTLGKERGLTGEQMATSNDFLLREKAMLEELGL
jgi:peptidoglycan/xylan/chitin deacetylase (PgdA/CDA1 family)